MKKTILTVLVIVLFALAGAGYAAEDVGAVVALKGSAFIERDAKATEAKLKDGIQLRDSFETRDRAKAKMLFVDDSVLTMGEKSRVVIKEFLYSKDKRGRAIFNLIDGKVRSVVGKSEFEVQTPTVVAAARGTVFDCETGRINGKQYSKCTCYEGVVDIRSIDPTITGRVSLRAGMTVTVMSGQAPPVPTVVPAAPTAAATGSTVDPIRAIQSPPVVQQPPAGNTTPVNVGIKLPPVPVAPPGGSIKVGW